MRRLINDATIRQEDRGRIVYWHVELDRHDVLLAEGLPAESYLDTGNRGFFADAPAAAPGPSAREGMEHARFRALGRGRREPLEAARARLARRAAALGAPVPEAVQVEIAGAGQWVAIIPAVRHPGPRNVFPPPTSRATSAAWAPPSMARLVFGRDAVATDFPTLPRADGFHRPEDGFRWTDGEGLLLLPSPSRNNRPPAAYLGGCSGGVKPARASVGGARLS